MTTADPAERLLIAHAESEPAGRRQEGRLLLIEGGAGDLPAAFAPACDETFCQNSRADQHASLLAAAARGGLPRTTCILADLPHVEGALVPEAWPSPAFPPGHFDRVVFRLGRGTALVNAALLQAFALLRPGGTLLVCGRNQEGVRSFARRAEGVFGNANLLMLKSSCRLLEFRKENAEPPEALPDPRYFEFVPHSLSLPDGQAVEYLTKPGVFAYRGTDPGTALLARRLPPLAGLRVLDFGCGSGVLSLAAFRLGAAEVTATDISVVATACASHNFRLRGHPGRTACAPLAEGIEDRFDLILANPPFHDGPETDYSLPGRILDALRPRLEPGGQILLVANRFLDYAGEGRRRFPHGEILAREQGYLVHRFRA